MVKQIALKIKLFILFFAICGISSAQNLQWANAISGPYDEYGCSIAVDRNGNVYTTGCFNYTTDFDPGPGTFNITSNGNLDIFVCKRDVLGNFVWAKQIGGISDDYGYSISLDTSGNVYLAGIFEDTVDFDPGIGTFYLNTQSEHTNDLFVCKLDSSGNLIWAKDIGGAGCTNGYSITLDASGNSYTTGLFSGVIDFDPGPGTYNLTPKGNSDFFVSKLNASGNFVWAKRMGGWFSEAGYSIAVDDFGNVYTTGMFIDTVDFDPGPGTYNIISSFGEDGFISKLDSSGNFVWAKKIGRNGQNYSWSIAIDTDGNIYTTGYFTGSVDFDPGPGTFYLSSLGSNDIYICKIDSLGNFVWAKRFGDSAGAGGGKSIAVDESGNVYSTGYFSFTVDFDPGPGTYNLISKESIDIFISKLNASGDFVWATRIGGLGEDQSYSIITDDGGNAYVTGYFSDTVDFDPSNGEFNLISAGFFDEFVYKLGTLTGLEELTPSFYFITIFPNPFSIETTLQTDVFLKNAILYVYNSVGQQVKQINNISGQAISLRRDNLANGLYFIRLTEDGKTYFTGKLIINDN